MVRVQGVNGPARRYLALANLCQVFFHRWKLQTCSPPACEDMNLIRLVTFDALHTIITPRYPIYVQYSQVFAPYVGILPPDAIKRSFKVGEETVLKPYCLC